ncbi:MAG: hypothetical protein HPY54_00745 [Chthonomonadetes bacterium]|nr:hypothetical protein [Chthonomonadetes bacterium]
MKRLMTGFLVLLAMLTIYPVAVAQAAGKDIRPGKPAYQRVRRWEAIARWLNLTDEQKAKIKNIWQNAREQAQKIRSDTSLKPEEKRARLRELRRSTRQEIGSVLTPEQRTKWERLRLWAWHRWQMARAYRAGKIARALGLSKAQEKEMARIFGRAREARRRIWMNPDLTPGQKWQRLMELRRRNWGEIYRNLTPEQQRKLRAFIGAGRRR